MNKNQILNLFNSFIVDYDEKSKIEIWQKQSQTFRGFWNEKIINETGELNDNETDQIIRILDKNAKGNTRESQAVAKAMIPQGVWRKMFNELKNKKELSGLLNSIFQEEDNNRKIELINKLYKVNESNKNSLTGKNGNALNAMLFAHDPEGYISIISLNHRNKIIEYLGFPGGPDFETASPGEKIILTNKVIIDGFKSWNINNTPKTISVFLYTVPVKPLWNKESEDDEVPWGGLKPTETEITHLEITDPHLFYMESQLEDFLIENWEKTELGQKYDLIEEDGELISQQYKTDIGRIDILVKDKKTGQYVVIELKKNQTSDDTVGQLSRYMGWLEEYKTNGQPAKGIIIAAQYDERLYFALKKIKDVEVYLYQVDFKLKEFKK